MKNSSTHIIVALISLMGVLTCTARHEPGHVDYGGFEIPTDNARNGRMRDRGPGSLKYTTLPVLPKKPTQPITMKPVID